MILVQGLKALYPEDGGPGSVEVVPADLDRLQPGEFLNDTIIDFYMRYGFTLKAFMSFPALKLQILPLHEKSIPPVAAHLDR